MDRTARQRQHVNQLRKALAEATSVEEKQALHEWSKRWRAEDRAEAQREQGHGCPGH